MVKAFVHGNPETDAIWGPLVEALAQRGVDDVVLLSPPGFGAPTPPDWDATASSYVSWLQDELVALGGEVDLVGHDWGAGHTYGLIATRPDLVRSWAADCAGLLHPDYEWHRAAQLWQQPDAGEQWVDQMLALSDEERAEQYRAFGLSDEVARALAAAFDEAMGRCILRLYRSAAQPALVELGQQLMGGDGTTRGLVLNPTGDPYVSAELGAEVAQRLGAERVDLDAAHWWMLEDPTPAADALIAFWSRG